MRHRILVTATLLALGLCAGTAAAAPCAGFVDVDDANPATAPFCGNVEWLKNRSITLGCTDTVHYCPGDSVSRLAMAAFMNRLGKALTPEFLHREQFRTNVTVTGTEQMVCETVDYSIDAAGYPRQARFQGSVFGHPSGGDSWLQGWWKYSTNGGSSWSTIGTLGQDQLFGRDWASFGQVVGFAVTAPNLPLLPGTTYRFGIAINSSGNVTYTFNPLWCQAEVMVLNRNPTTSPLDAE